MRPSDITDGNGLRPEAVHVRGLALQSEPSDITDGNEAPTWTTEAYYRRKLRSEAPAIARCQSILPTEPGFNEAVGPLSATRDRSTGILTDDQPADYSSVRNVGFNEAVGYYRGNAAKTIGLG